METVKDATKKLRRIFSGDEGGNVEELKKILSEFPALMNQDLNLDGSTVLMQATSGNHLQIVEYLLSLKDIHVNKQNKLGSTALHLSSSADAVKLLLAHPDIDINIKDKNGKIASEVCSKKVSMNEVEAVRELFENYKRAKSPKRNQVNSPSSLSQLRRQTELEVEDEEERYMEEALNQGKREWRRGKLILLGDNRSNRSSVASAILGKKYDNTIENTVTTSRFTLSVLDVGGQAAVTLIHPFLLTNFGIYLIIFDLVSLNSHASAEKKQECIKNMRECLNSIIIHTQDEVGECPPIFFIGTRKDIIHSAEEDLQISKLIAELFSGSVAWPSVVMNRDFEGLEGKVDLCFYPFNNSMTQDNDTLKRLLQVIEETIDTCPYVHVERPLSWFQALEVLMAQRRKITLSYEDAKWMSINCGIPEDKVPLLLRFLHEMTILMWHDEEKLKDLVVLDPIEYLVKPAAILMNKNVPDEVDEVLQVLEVHRSLKRQNGKDFQEMTARGIITEKLLQSIVQSDAETYSHIKELMIHYGFILPLALTPMTINGSGKEKKADEKVYLAPALLPELRRIFSLLEGSSSKQFYFLFTTSNELQQMTTISLGDCRHLGFSPAGLFEKLISKAILWSMKTSDFVSRDTLYGCHKNAAELMFGNQSFRIFADPRYHLISVLVDGKNPLSIHDRLANHLREIIAECLKSLKFITLLRYETEDRQVTSITQIMNRGPEEEAGVLFIRLDQIRALTEKKSALSLHLGGRSLLSTQEAIRSYGPWLSPDTYSHHQQEPRWVMPKDSAFTLPSQTAINPQRSLRDLLEKKRLRMEESPLPSGSPTHSVGKNSPRYTSPERNQEFVETKADIRKHIPIIEWFPERAPKLMYSEPISKELHYDVIAKNRKGKTIPGKFFYHPSPETILPAGKQKLSITFIPQDTIRYLSTSEERFIEIEKKKPVVTWTYSGGNILYLTPLPESVYAGIESEIPGGTYEYSHPVGTILELGLHYLHVKYYPDAAYSNNYSFGYAKLTIEVSGTIVPLTWNLPVPDQFEEKNILKDDELIKKMVQARSLEKRGKEGFPIIYPDPLPNWIFSAKCLVFPRHSIELMNEGKERDREREIYEVEGRYEYSHQPGDVLPAGYHTISVTFHPTDLKKFHTTSATKQIFVYPTTVTLFWKKPYSIIDGEPLDSTLLTCQIIPVNAPGQIIYEPPVGTILPLGTHPLRAKFIPRQPSNYLPEEFQTEITIRNKKQLRINWFPPEDIIYLTPLSYEQLNATLFGYGANSKGRFVYKPDYGTILSVGEHQLTVEFLSENVIFQNVSASVTLRVLPCQSKLIWAQPNPVFEGESIYENVLNCTCINTIGEFKYSIERGSVLKAGLHTLTVHFEPYDHLNFLENFTKVNLMVRERPKFQAKLHWSHIYEQTVVEYGFALNSNILNAKCTNFHGSFSYTPPLDTVLPVGEHELFAYFTPEEPHKCLSGSIKSRLIVVKRTPLLIWSPTKGYNEKTKLFELEYGEKFHQENYLTAYTVMSDQDSKRVFGDFIYTTKKGNRLIKTITFNPTLQKTTTNTNNKRNSIMKEEEEKKEMERMIALTSSNLALDCGEHVIRCCFVPSDTHNFESVETEISIFVTRGRPHLYWDITSVSSATSIGGSAALPLSPPASASKSMMSASTASTPLKDDKDKNKRKRFIFPFSLNLLPRPVVNDAAIKGRFEFQLITKEKPKEDGESSLHPSHQTNEEESKLEITTSPLKEKDNDTEDSLISRKRINLESLIDAGEHRVIAQFYPEDINNYLCHSVEIEFEVVQAVPAIIWEPITTVTFGTILTKYQHGNAYCTNIANPISGGQPGEFIYSPPMGTMITIGLADQYNPIDELIKKMKQMDAEKNKQLQEQQQQQQQQQNQLQSSSLITSSTSISESLQPHQQQHHHHSDMKAQQTNSNGNNRILIESIAENYNASQHNTHYLKIELSFTFIPYNINNYKTMTMKKELIIERRSANILWTVPYRIPYGSYLDEKIYNAELSEHDIANIQSYHSINKDNYNQKNGKKNKRTKKRKKEKSKSKNQAVKVVATNSFKRSPSKKQVLPSSPSGSTVLVKGTKLEEDDITRLNEEMDEVDDEEGEKEAEGNDDEFDENEEDDEEDDDDEDQLYRLEYDPPLNTLLNFTQREFMIKVTFIPLKNLIYFYNETIKILYIDIYPIPPIIIWKPKFTSLQEGNPLDRKFHCNATVDRPHLFPGELIYDPPIGSSLAPGHYNIICEYLPKFIENELPIKTQKHFEVVKKPPKIVLVKDEFTGKVTVKRIYEGMEEENSNKRKSPPSSPKRRSPSPRQKFLLDMSSASQVLPETTAPPPPVLTLEDTSSFRESKITDSIDFTETG